MELCDAYNIQIRRIWCVNDEKKDEIRQRNDRQTDSERIEVVVKKQYQEREQRRSEKLQQKQKEDDIEEGGYEQGRLFSALGALGMNKGNWAKEIDAFEQGIGTVRTARDFLSVFGSYVQAEEVLITTLMRQYSL
ncbi:MAG: hypothetical protein EZS28_013079 [Streblomastix strix]|uniref:Pre-mRNA-splicing factor SYF1 central HAT repeats domain-containing protein n=1 Tax=Streblomastix strix TaxID=222440 RepID=A0A5J4W9Q0_9EUKA|nr:MAG: hypothetical protein EZS28_013079 [Streblomastix strix]